MTNSWMNSDGEPIMDGAAWRFEQQLDAEYQPDPYDDYDDYYEECAGDFEDCPEGGCSTCWPDEDYDYMEDRGLDGYYEE